MPIRCIKCAAPYKAGKTRDHQWQKNTDTDDWFCNSCVREATRDAEKEFRWELNNQGGEWVNYSVAKAARRSEFWASLYEIFAPMPVAQLPPVPDNDSDIDMLWSCIKAWIDASPKTFGTCL